MAEIHALKCDNCDVQVEFEPASLSGWLEVTTMIPRELAEAVRAGVKAETEMPLFVVGNFCGIKCTIEGLIKTRHEFVSAGIRPPLPKHWQHKAEGATPEIPGPASTGFDDKSYL